MLIHLTSASLEEDPRLADYTSMTDAHLRKSLEVERGLYMAESTNVIIRALEAGHHPRSLIMAPRWLPDLEPLLERFLGAKDGGEVPVFIAPEPILEASQDSIFIVVHSLQCNDLFCLRWLIFCPLWEMAPSGF